MVSMINCNRMLNIFNHSYFTYAQLSTLDSRNEDRGDMVSITKFDFGLCSLGSYYYLESNKVKHPTHCSYARFVIP